MERNFPNLAVNWKQVIFYAKKKLSQRSLNDDYFGTAFMDLKKRLPKVTFAAASIDVVLYKKTFYLLKVFQIKITV